MILLFCSFRRLVFDFPNSFDLSSLNHQPSTFLVTRHMPARRRLGGGGSPVTAFADDIQSHPQGERFGAELYGGRLRAFASRSREAGDSVLVNNEIGRAWRTRQDVRKYAAEQGITEETAIKQGLKQKATEFAKSGSEVYAKT